MFFIDLKVFPYIIGKFHRKKGEGDSRNSDVDANINVVPVDSPKLNNEATIDNVKVTSRRPSKKSSVRRRSSSFNEVYRPNSPSIQPLQKRHTLVISSSNALNGGAIRNLPHTAPELPRNFSLNDNVLLSSNENHTFNSLGDNYMTVGSADITIEFHKIVNAPNPFFNNSGASSIVSAEESHEKKVRFAPMVV